MARRSVGSDTRVAGPERAALVGLVAGRARRLDAERSLDELAGLAEAAGAKVVLRVLQERPKPDSATFLGSGKIKALAESCAETDVDVVVFDNELSPSQLRQITEAVDRKVLDRTQLILDIFAARARTREGKLQVELAQLKYLLPRLVGAGTALSRLGGGIGTGVLVKPSSKPIDAESGRGFMQSARRSTRCGNDVRNCASGVGKPRCRRSRWSATRTRAKRRSSIG